MGVEALPSTISFTGKFIIITGATSGLGYEAAVLYVRLGAETVYITSRTAAKGAEAKTAIEVRTGKRDIVRVRILDIDTFEGVRKFLAIVKSEIKSIDVALLNAGLQAFTFGTLPEGWESSMQVNTLSTALLALLLLPWMNSVRRKSQTQHLTFTGSASHWAPRIEDPRFPKQSILNYFDEEAHFEWRVQYARSKLLLQYAIAEIAKLTLDEGGSPSPIVNSVCPGMIHTDIGREFRNQGPLHKLLYRVFMWWKSLPASEGAKALVVATTKDEHGSFQRPYLTDKEFTDDTNAHRKSKMNITSLAGQEMQAKVWKDKNPEVSKIVRL